MLTLNVILVVSLNMFFIPTEQPNFRKHIQAKRKKKGGWPNLEKNLALTILLSNQMNLMTSLC